MTSFVIGEEYREALNLIKQPRFGRFGLAARGDLARIPLQSNRSTSLNSPKSPRKKARLRGFAKIRPLR